MKNTGFFILVLDCEWKIEKETRLGNDGDFLFTKDGLPESWASLEDAKTSCLKTPECTGITNDDGQFLLRTSREKVSDPGKTRTVFKMIFGLSINQHFENFSQLYLASRVYKTVANDYS